MALPHHIEYPNQGAVAEKKQEPVRKSQEQVGDINTPDAAVAEQPTTETSDSPRPRTRSQTGSHVKRRLPNGVDLLEFQKNWVPRSAQTGSSAKRRLPKDLDILEFQKTWAPQKKAKSAPKKRLSPIDTGPKEDAVLEAPVADSQDVSQSTTRSSSPYSSTSPFTFLESSASPGYGPERRGPRSRATLPVPVPNLTKKSRGRRVPTQDVTEAQGAPTDKRMYVCEVDGCGKCFHRGEHLKRHIRSIHTHEKPFECTHPSCGKFFNRHDNLLQHLKVHNSNFREENGNPRPILQLSPTSSSPSLEPGPAMQHETDSSASDSEDEEEPLTDSMKSKFPMAPVVYEPYVSSARFDVACEPFTTFSTTNMAVSSLRTELAPRSPPTSRVRDSL